MGISGLLYITQPCEGHAYHAVEEGSHHGPCMKCISPRALCECQRGRSCRIGRRKKYSVRNRVPLDRPVAADFACATQDKQSACENFFVVMLAVCVGVVIGGFLDTLPLRTK